MAKGRSRNNNQNNIERGRLSTTNELDSLLSNTPDYSPLFTPYTLEAAPLEVKDRRQHIPQAPVRRASKIASRSSVRSTYSNFAGQYKWLLCRRRQERREVLHAVFKKRGGIGAARRFFKHPVRTIYSKIVCRG